MLIRSRPLVCSIASFSCFGAQQPTGRAAWVGCTASANSTASLSPKEFNSFSWLALADVNEANFHLHTILYGLIAPLLDRANGKPTEEIEQLRIPVVGAPKPT